MQAAEQSSLIVGSHMELVVSSISGHVCIPTETMLRVFCRRLSFGICTWSCSGLPDLLSRAPPKVSDIAYNNPYVVYQEGLLIPLA